MSGLELKPCPFCGGEAKLVTFVRNNAIPPYAVAYVKCSACRATANDFSDSKGDGSYIFNAAEAWNRRIKDEDQT